MALPALTTVRARTVFAPLDEGGRAGTVARRLAQAITLGLLPVSYTHLTLPTILLV